MMGRIEGSFAALLAALACQSTTTTMANPDESDDVGGASSSVAAIGGEGGSDPGTEVATDGGKAPASLTSRTVSTGGSRAALASSTHRGGSGGVAAASVSSSLASGGTSASSSSSATGGVSWSTPVTATGGAIGTGGSKASTTREPDSCHMWRGIQDSYGKTIELEDLGLCYSYQAPGRYWCGPGGQCRQCTDPVSGGGLTLDCDRDGICETDARSNTNCGACGNVCDSVCEPSSYGEWYSCRI